jgi:inosine-uridine nucleoside N-ribohydrolase
MWTIITALFLLATARAVQADSTPAEKKVPILLDTDIGSDIDDAFALALALASPEVDLQGVTTVGSGAEDRAWIVCRFLTAVGRRSVPVAFGRDPQPKSAIEGQIQYRRHPAVIFNRTSRPVKKDAVEFLYSRLKAQPGKLTIVALGPLTNIARLLKQHADCKRWIKRIVVMGGAIRLGYNGKLPVEPEWNIKSDVAAARMVFVSGVPLVVAPLDATVMLQLEDPARRRLFAACTPLTFQVQALYQLWDKATPTLFDPVAVALAFTEKFCTMEDLHLEIDDSGLTRTSKGKPNARVATAIRKDEFVSWYVDRVSAGTPVLPSPPANPSKLIERGGMPNRVHCIEDYETDIEKRWWMSGKAETVNVPPLSRRACRGVLTQDFDDRQGDTKTMYTTVIFNPVPGPPMGKNPRLGFRYWLKGTDTLRVQIYSLSKGYHRYLSLTGLPQQKWQKATVDMTTARRPDGSGGPLSEDERIDDVQFYVDPRAELIIDDLVLYDAAVHGENRPFPRNFHFTGWFDTGRQGKEWPGAFEIVDKKGYFWKAARSIPDKATNTPWILLGLRGERPLAARTQLFFRYHLSGGKSMRISLHNCSTRESHFVVPKDLKNDKWAEASVDFADSQGSKPRAGDRVDRIGFLLPKGAELLIDDVLLHEPGSTSTPLPLNCRSRLPGGTWLTPTFTKGSLRPVGPTPHAQLDER